MSSVVEGRDRLQAALTKLSRRARARARDGEARGGRHAGVPAPPPVAPAPPLVRAEPRPEASRGRDPVPPVRIAIDLSELVDRLERIEEKISDLQRVPRPRPATGELFAEWVRLRRWEEIPFGDFLRLRRAGVL